MTPTNLVTSLEWSKKLRAAGVPQESFFRWEVGIRGTGLIWQDYHQNVRVIDTADLRQYFSAYTSGELDNLLPYTALGAYLNIFKGVDDWSVGYGLEKTLLDISGANARAAMLEYLITNGLVDVKQLKANK